MRRLALLCLLVSGCTDRVVVIIDDDADAVDADAGDTETGADTGCTPLDLADFESSLGSPCASSCACQIGLECMDGLCGPCPAGNPGCACESGDVCDVGLSCRAGVCV